MVTLQGIKTCHLAEWTGQESGAQGNGGHCTIYIPYFYLNNEQCSVLRQRYLTTNNQEPKGPGNIRLEYIQQWIEQSRRVF